MSAREFNRATLIDYAVAHPRGFYNVDAMADLGWSRATFNNTLRDARHYLGDEDIGNITADPTGIGGPWLYRLVGALDETRVWTANRQGDTDTRLRTMHAMLASIIQRTDGRSVEGRKARVTEKALRRLIEDLDDIDLNGAA